MSQKFAKQVNTFFFGIPKYSDSLPVYNDETEGDYNKRVADSDPDLFALRDKKKYPCHGSGVPGGAMRFI